MDKIIVRTSVFLSFFVGSWLILQQINWLRLLPLERYEQMTQNVEVSLGERMLTEFEYENFRISDSLTVTTVNNLVDKLCMANGIDSKELRVYVFKNDEVNAFAIPDKQLIVYSGLIEQTESPEALCGVLAHELAHIQKRHVMKSLLREMGLGTIFSIFLGNNQLGMITNIGKSLSSTAFSRKMEKEADLTGLAYLEKAQIDPRPFAEFIGVIDGEETTPKALQWVSTHPLPEDRKNYLLKNIKQKQLYAPVLPLEVWEQLQEQLQNNDDDDEQWIDDEIDEINVFEEDDE